MKKQAKKNTSSKTVIKSTFVESYRKFLSYNKTERLCVDYSVKTAKSAGFYEYSPGKKLNPGDKVYFVNKNKNFAAFIIGKNMNSGIRLLGAHIDSPRLDIKTNPLYEKDGIGYFDTQYYGGIKKYQWVARPLAIYGVVCKTDGTTVNIAIGDEPEDPVFCISDLLPHLDKKLYEKKASDFINGENLDVIIGTEKLQSADEKELVKKNLLKILKQKYDIEENDFSSAELEVVPAGDARYNGIDKTLIAGYGQDDRVCAYTSLMAVMNTAGVPDQTIGVVLVDKEEIGSTCATGSKSRWLEDVLYRVSGCSNREELIDVLYNTKMLSSDVTAAFDPIYADVSNKDMTAKLGSGLMFSKYNGGRGKGEGADANPEYIAYVRKLMNDADIHYQFDTMGKVDVGGGGTIASIVSSMNIDVLDAGIPVLNMHSPMELTHVDDIYAAYLGYTAFLMPRK